MRFANAIILAVSVAVSFFLAEQILGLLGSPATRELQVTHPPNYRELRENIEFTYEFATNSEGLRYHEIPLQKPAGQTCFIVLGDSYTEGFGVEQDETFTPELEKRFNKSENNEVRFINGGLSGVGPTEYWRVLYKVGMKYDLDYVIVCLQANDLFGVPRNLILRNCII